MDILQKIYENNYYVYEHYLDDELFYIGKGKGKRCLDLESRTRRWKAKVNGRENDVVVKIIETFKTEEEALMFERRRIIQFSKTCQLTNFVFNNNAYEYDEELYEKKFAKQFHTEYFAGKRENKIYLSEIIKKENVNFTNNNLIFAPSNSGKTIFAKSLIKANELTLFLVSTDSSKLALISQNENDEDTVIFSARHLNSAYGNLHYALINGILKVDSQYKKINSKVMI